MQLVAALFTRGALVGRRAGRGLERGDGLLQLVQAPFEALDALADPAHLLLDLVVAQAGKPAAISVTQSLHLARRTATLGIHGHTSRHVCAEQTYSLPHT